MTRRVKYASFTRLLPCAFTVGITLSRWCVVLHFGTRALLVGRHHEVKGDDHEILKNSSDT